jgi:hypothetical protein
MNISEKVKSVIVEQILKINFDNKRQDIPSKGRFTIESNYELAINEKMPKYIFVVTTKIDFHNHQIDGKGYGLYAFYSINGKLDTDFDSRGGCYYGFFQDIKIIETII